MHTETPNSRGLYIRVPVEIVDERTDPHEPRDELGAFLWLVTHASRSDRSVRTPRGEIELRRGEVIAAADHLAKEWLWGRKKVRNRLERWVRAGRLLPGPPTRHRPATFFIVDFDLYQGAGAARLDDGATKRATKGPPTGHHGATPLDLRDSGERDSPLPPSGATPLDCVQAFEAFNALALRVGIKQASKLTPGRKQKIAARLKEHGREGWMQALGHIEISSFLTGQSGGTWRATLDWLLKPDSFVKVLEGNYGNGRHNAAPAQAVQVKSDAQIAAENEEALRQLDMHPEGRA